MKATVSINTDIISKEDYITELTTAGTGDVDRPLTVLNKPGRIIEIDVTEQEFDQVLMSDKVRGADSERIPVVAKINNSRSITPNTSSTNNIDYDNWGLAAMTQNSTTYASTFTYEYDGTGVDCVIMDTGIVDGHPEFNDTANVASRIKKINWGGTQGSNFYTDPDGHGTHVAGIMAGRTQGWASNADIYSFTTNLGSLTHGYSPLDMDYITSWHQSKTNGKPTVVNMSWGLSTYYPPNHPDYYYSTTAWLGGANPTYHMYRSATYDSLVSDMANAGVIVVCSAGNDNEQIYEDSESGWDNGYWYFFDSGNNEGYGTNEKIYYANSSYSDPDNSPIVGGEAGSYNNTLYFQSTNRGQTPSNAWLDQGTGVRKDIAVQAHSSSKSKSSYSNYGTPLTIWAPGDYIQSSYINASGAVQLGSTGYYYKKLNGTSMASPQVAGMLACYVSKDTTQFQAGNIENQSSALTFLNSDGQRSNDINNFGVSLTNLNRAYMPYQDYTVTWNLGNAEATHNLGTFNIGDTFSYDFSTTFRNAASEQLHDVSHSITVGALPDGCTLALNGTSSGSIERYFQDTTVNFTVSSTNDFDTETKDYTLDIVGDPEEGWILRNVRMTGVKFV